MKFAHKPVLLEETIENLHIRPDGIYVDGTLGGAGHAYEICKRLGREGRFVGIDQDGDAIEAASVRLKPFEEYVTIIRSNFSDMISRLSELGIAKVDGILLDLGVSSYQLDNAHRGFSYRYDAPLDMRMDTRQEMTAADIINTYDEEELFKIIRTYGEERFASRIASNIVTARAVSPICTTGELAGIIDKVIPKKSRLPGHNPAARTFQAIRIELNRELFILENSLDDMIDILSEGGRICVITFHSLEDRIVKNSFKRNENPCTCPKSFPVCICGKKSKGRVITRKPIVPSDKELNENLRSRSSKLRVFERSIS